jgi:hypothetical protein
VNPGSPSFFASYDVADQLNVSLYGLVEVLIHGVSSTFGFEDCLTVEPSTPVFLPEDEAVPESLTLSVVCEAFRVTHIPSRGLHSVHASALALINEHGRAWQMLLATSIQLVTKMVCLAGIACHVILLVSERAYLAQHVIQLVKTSLFLDFTGIL